MTSIFLKVPSKSSRMVCMTTVTVYTSTTCPYCKMLEDFLKEKNLPFIEKFVDTDEAVKEEMSALSGGFLGVPFTKITTDSGNIETVIGFDKGRLCSVLGIQQ